MIEDVTFLVLEVYGNMIEDVSFLVREDMPATKNQLFTVKKLIAKCITRNIRQLISATGLPTKPRHLTHSNLALLVIMAHYNEGWAILDKMLINHN
jgi:hypothetical protein